MGSTPFRPGLSECPSEIATQLQNLRGKLEDFGALENLRGHVSLNEIVDRVNVLTDLLKGCTLDRRPSPRQIEDLVVGDATGHGMAIRSHNYGPPTGVAQGSGWRLGPDGRVEAYGASAAFGGPLWYTDGLTLTGVGQRLDTVTSRYPTDSDFVVDGQLHIYRWVEWGGVWAPATAYSLGEYVANQVTVPTGVYQCIQAGTSGGTPPAWVGNAPVTDNSVRWYRAGIYSVPHWEEVHTAGVTNLPLVSGGYQALRGMATAYPIVATGVLGYARISGLHGVAVDGVQGVGVTGEGRTGGVFLGSYNGVSAAGDVWDISGQGARISSAGALCVRLVAGEALSAGQIVACLQSGGADGRVWRVPTGVPELNLPVGAVVEDAAVGQPVLIAVCGRAPVLPESGVTAARGQVIYTSGTEAGRVGQATAVSSAMYGRVVGRWLDAGTGAGAATYALLHFY